MKKMRRRMKKNTKMRRRKLKKNMKRRQRRKKNMMKMRRRQNKCIGLSTTALELYVSRPIMAVNNLYRKIQLP